MMDITEIIIKKIEEYENISLFFHERPDFDALGSCFAVREFINDNFKNKNVKIIGLDTLSELYGSSLFKFDAEQNASSNEFISSSLGIISDTANTARVYSRKNTLCKETIRVDHHPQIETFADYEWIDPMIPATCEMWGSLFLESKLKLSAQCAKYLYAGILTDTGRFLHSNTLPSTYEVTSKLISTGFRRSEVHDSIYLREPYQIEFTNYLMKRMHIENGVAYFVIPKGAHKKFNIYPQFSMVHLLSDIKGVYIWTTVYFDEQTLSWKGSMRSRDIQINHIASEFNGGGHKFAAGYTLENEKDFYKVVERLQSYLAELQNQEG
ncbi:bifunctional oligoribonuclease/PAP phosphatase NrnA [Malacoplasma penetrans]|uniref:Predicted phosphoesterase n=1 Tax=Malacoplasma penetrans (strain HF-2) TaxID=272633 RepID=Q8EVH9_MALP2|nr:bifunctional oligoribonuclease/PAP phosphatase NrnA [Malacoplasma penetrans]RXY96916.1 bifunctional oligoribonuclease/PAP phosphatase NrnA [Malacoplasma penetrans]BAC44375.1 predicted phosphoesterase [Malacoplasma penetrans HF-2]